MTAALDLRPLVSYIEPATIERTGENAPPTLLARPFRTVAVMCGDPPAPPRMLVTNFLVDRDVNLLAGVGGVGKSPLMLHTALCVALGRAPFNTLTLGRAGGVLMVLPEDGEAVARMMLDAMSESMDLNDDDRALLRTRLHMIGDDERVNLLSDATRLADTALEHEAVLVCCDPIRNLLGGAAENDNDVAGVVVDSLRREVCRRAGAAVLLSHHLRKPGKDSAVEAEPTRYDVRGGGGWVDGSRLTLGVRKTGTRITVTSMKSNRVANDLRHELELTIDAAPDNAAQWLRCAITDTNAGSMGGPSQTLTPGIGRPINANERLALEAIDDRYEPGRRVPISEWNRTAGLNPETLKSIKNRLLKAGLAEAIPAGQHRNGGKTYSYAITDRGREALETGVVKGERVRG